MNDNKSFLKSICFDKADIISLSALNTTFVVLVCVSNKNIFDKYRVAI